MFHYKPTLRSLSFIDKLLIFIETKIKSAIKQNYECFNTIKQKKLTPSEFKLNLYFSTHTNSTKKFLNDKGGRRPKSLRNTGLTC